MPHPGALLRMAVTCIMAATVCGCASGRVTQVTTGERPFWREWLQPAPKAPVQPAIQVPSELKNERDLTLKYAQWMVSTGSTPSIQEATRKYKELLAKDPQDVEATIGLAKIDEISGLPERAEEGYRQAIEYSPDSAVAHAALAEFFATKKRWPEAIEHYHRAVLADPHDRNVRMQLATSMVHNGDVAGAIPHLTRISSSDAEAYYQAAVILKQDGRIAQAEEQLNIALAKNPQLMEARHLLTEISRPVRDRSVMPASAFSQQPSMSQPPVVTPAGGVSRNDGRNPRSVVTAGHSFAG